MILQIHIVQSFYKIEYSFLIITGITVGFMIRKKVITVDILSYCILHSFDIVRVYHHLHYYY
jgi:hypothetical protein